MTLQAIPLFLWSGMCPHIICVSPSSSAANVGKEDSCGGYGGSGSMKSLGKSFSRYLYSLSCFSSSQVTIGSSSYQRASSSSLHHILASPRSWLTANDRFPHDGSWFCQIQLYVFTTNQMYVFFLTMSSKTILMYDHGEKWGINQDPKVLLFFFFSPKDLWIHFGFQRQKRVLMDVLVKLV